MLIIDLINKRMSGSAKVRDIRKYGLVKASSLTEEEKRFLDKITGV